MEWNTENNLYVEYNDGSKDCIPGGKWEFSAIGIVLNYGDMLRNPIVRMHPWHQIKQVMQFTHE